VRRSALPQGPEPRIIGIDDWAWRKGHRYGTIVVDLERGCPIDVLEDRAAATVADWLQSHPEVKIVARDRAEAYGAGIRQGAPEATQVADRFHLLKNLASALQEVFSAHHLEIANLNNVPQNELLTRDDGSVAVAVVPPAVTSRAQQQIEYNRARRVAEYEQARDLRQQGWTIKAIAARIGRNRRTVKKYLQASRFPERQPRRRRYPRVLDPCKAYLAERWQAGCHNAKQLFGEITSQGFRGQYSIVAAYTSRLRTTQERVYKRRRSGPCATLTEADKPLTPRGATWLVLRREAKLDDAQRQQIARLREHEGEIAEAITLVQDFANLVRQRQPDKLDTWLARALASCLQPFQSFATDFPLLPLLFEPFLSSDGDSVESPHFQRSRHVAYGGAQK
jgi:transposase